MHVFRNTESKSVEDVSQPQQASHSLLVTHEIAQRTVQLEITLEQLLASQQLSQAVFDTVWRVITVFEAIRDEQHQIIDFWFVFSGGVADHHMSISTKGKTLRTVTLGYVDEVDFQRSALRTSHKRKDSPTEIFFLNASMPLLKDLSLTS